VCEVDARHCSAQAIAADDSSRPVSPRGFPLDDNLLLRDAASTQLDDFHLLRDTPTCGSTRRTRANLLQVRKLILPGSASNATHYNLLLVS
jgi:hypothetical protein